MTNRPYDPMTNNERARSDKYLTPSPEEPPFCSLNF